MTMRFHDLVVKGLPQMMECSVCEYPFSDAHHTIPRGRAGVRENGSGISLCPNHHRFADVVAHLVFAGVDREDIENYARHHFDQAFVNQWLDVLINIAIATRRVYADGPHKT
jgi:hypothetical protein